MKAVLVAGGKSPCKDILLEELKNAHIIVCADGGAKVLFQYKITPDVLLGDFDSIDKEILNYYKNINANIKIYPPEKDYTDSEIAFNEILKIKDVTEIVLLGCTGTRIDHLIGNLGLLYKGLMNSINVYIRDNNNLIFLTNKSVTLKRNFGNYISFQGFREDVKDFSIKGAKYELYNHNLVLGDPLTISNEFLGNEIKIEFKNGVVMVIYSRD